MLEVKNQTQLTPQKGIRMKPRVSLLLLVGVSLISSLQTQALVGYVNVAYAPGDHLFTPPLWVANNNTGPQYLSQIFSAGVPELTAVSLWNVGTLNYEPASIFSSGSWSTDLNLLVGTGALLSTVTSFTNTFVGEVDSAFAETPLPHVGLGDGYYLLGNRIPVASAGYSNFDGIIGRAPVEGEQIVKLDQTFTFHGGSGQWLDESFNVAIPTLAIAEAAFFNLGPVVVPEPATFALFGFGSMALLMVRRRR
jgi:hypothetical protein